MSASATHPCDACGGTGVGSDREPIGVPGFVAMRCAICRGAGSFPDRMPIADAVADATTLWLVSLNIYRDNPEPFEALERARLLICHAIADASVVDPLGRTKNAARAAFRAVPGLRGEE